MKREYDIAIIGGGIVGLATAYKIQEHYPDLCLVVIEKEPQLAAHQTGHNSGVIHSGLYYKPGSFRAKNCLSGRKQLVAFATKHHIPFDICGKIVVATDEKELPHMERVFNNGIQNQVEGIEKINSDQIMEIEPYCKGVAGLWVPCTGIIDFVSMAKILATQVKAINKASEVLTNCKVTAFTRQDNCKLFKTNKGDIRAHHAIFCGGLHSDRLAKKDKVNINTKIVGFRGDYYELTVAGIVKVRNLIYPVPNPEFPFLGVHFTRMIHGGVECGPNAVFTFKREGYSKTSFSLRDTVEALTFSGTWRLFFKHWKFGLDEYRRAFSKKLFHSRLKRLIPSLKMNDIKAGRAGVRAMALDKNGDAVDDFKIEYNSDSIHVLNAPSPAATACLSIGDHILKMAEKHFKLVK